MDVEKKMLIYGALWPMLVLVGGVVHVSVDQILGNLIVVLGFLSGLKAMVIKASLEPSDC